jgi:hypothetical protein
MRCFFPLVLLFFALIPGFAEAFTQVFEAEDLEHVAQPGDATEQSVQWKMAARASASGGAWVVPNSTKENPLAIESAQGASTSIPIPTAGLYYLWVRYAVHPVRAKPFKVTIQGNDLTFGTLPYGETASVRPADIYGEQEADKTGLIWTRREVTLAAGPSEITLSILNPRELTTGVIAHPPNVDELILTSDESLRP